jgi:hypothetical protein
MRRFFGLFLAATLPLAAAQTVSLAGEWRFRLGVQNPAEALTTSGDRSFLPGSTDQAGYGTRTSGVEKGWLSRPYTYEGPAFYEREVVIPATWRGKRITLFLERAHWRTQVWVDGKDFGSADSLSTPHVYDLTRGLDPGRHRLTLCVDNTYRIDVGRNAHSVTEHTQTNWNGVVGSVELRATDPVWIDAVELEAGRAVARIGNLTGAAVAGSLQSGGVVREFTAAPGETSVAIAIPAAPAHWDEFHPELYEVRVNLRAGRYADSWAMAYGAREISTRDRQFLVNGRPTFLRGTVECNIFPLTGYPPTDAASWERIFRIARSYGLNHFRFHSNTPPEAAFAAADRTGMLLHVELPVWTRIRNDAKTMEYMRAEGYRILKAYGNHPSFAMLGLGNEFSDNFPFLDELVAEFKKADPRRLYTFSADHTRHEPLPSSDYYIGQQTKAGRMRIHGSRMERTPPSTDFDFTQAIAGVGVPVLAHELGQWVTYPDFGEIARYTGVLRPRNLESFRQSLEGRGMIDQAHDFQLASGRFAWLLYKEEIETALRTPHYGGFQLLQLEDFPGQGEALVGLLDSFWESKRIGTAEEFRRFSSPTVPLARFAKHTWRTDETFTAKAEVAHYGERELAEADATWSLGDASGHFAKLRIRQGEVTPLGEVRVPLASVKAPAQLRLTLAIDGTSARNAWDIWVYPPAAEAAEPGDITITHSYDGATRQALAAGRKVLLLWPVNRASAGTLPNAFLPEFWSLSWFPQQAGTLGILCDPRHPALAGFPSEAHSNYQWWEVAQPSRAFILDDTPSDFRPIVQAIDDFHRNHKLGAVIEARVGEGKLLVSGFDLETDLEHRPAARQLRASLLAYMRGADFTPAPLETALVEKILSEAK